MLNKNKRLYELLVRKAGQGDRIRELNFDGDFDAFKNFIIDVDASVFKESDPALYKSLNIARFEANTNSDGKKLFNNFVMSYYSRSSDKPFIFQTDDGKLLLYFVDGDIRVPESIGRLLNAIYIYIYMEPYSPQKFVDLIKKRSDFFYQRYANQKNDTIQQILDRLSDDISRISFYEYMNQRYKAYVQGGYDIIWPGTPPAQTEAWRQERRSMNIPLPALPPTSLPCELSEFLDDIFVMEQYGIPGCQCEEGDRVIDAGAFIGDTAIYFANKAGKEGKIYSFEPLEENIASLKRTLEMNRAGENVVIAPFALSDNKKTLEFMFNFGSSAVNAEEGARGEGAAGTIRRVQAIDLDSYVNENKIDRVDFIKCDLEGADIDFLNGARETIKKFAPKCGLVVYHKPDDILDIPRILLECRPDYKFYFRMEAEPILFATL
ncbi:MAG: FkbM family methyltransferase [Desulfovibrio sp.]|nr:FkbM family methyltransferase [Desulfovibrio sp.]